MAREGDIERELWEGIRKREGETRSNSIGPRLDFLQTGLCAELARRCCVRDWLVKNKSLPCSCCVPNRCRPLGS